MTTRPQWTLTEAATHVDASRSTLRRRLDAGAFPNATRDPKGIWRIGIEDLLAAGFTLSKTWLTDTAHTNTEPVSNPVHPNENLLSTERAQLEKDLAHERAQPHDSAQNSTPNNDSAPPPNKTPTTSEPSCASSKRDPHKNPHHGVGSTHDHRK